MYMLWVYSAYLSVLKTQLIYLDMIRALMWGGY